MPCFRSGECLTIEKTNHPISIIDFIDEGGQGEVYKVISQNKTYAMKWYHPSCATESQKEIIQHLIDSNFNDRRFIMPLHFISKSSMNSFGYLMDWIPSHYKSAEKVQFRKIKADFSSLCDTGYNLADAFEKLHLTGHCYQDISFKNIFLKTHQIGNMKKITGDILICDNDNIVVNNSDMGNIGGTTKFMAPEIMKNEARPTTNTDLYSLSVLLFQLFFFGHPLEGLMEANIQIMDETAIQQLYGMNPVFIFDPKNDENRPVPGIHDNPLIYWRIYPQVFKNLFIKAFTDGLIRPERRLTENQWKDIFMIMKDIICKCSRCKKENLYDWNVVGRHMHISCWGCGHPLQFPPRLKIDNNYPILLNNGKKLYSYHFLGSGEINTNNELAEIRKDRRNRLEILNLSNRRWWAHTPLSNEEVEIPPRKSIIISNNLEIEFKINNTQTVQGKIRC